ncbi:MAG: VOC family protein [Defluviitaleaceae bacterium]|nr:VOC family protein [Defluviitaleaceae bacterium]MCL2239922.1 VOC family protein [Defluviitaleaceae bacterium]
MEKNMLGTSTVVQIGILVHDIEKTSQVFADFLGMDNPGWSLTGELKDAQTEFRGQPSPARAKLAFFPVGGNLTIELIEPDAHPSTWREDLDKNGEGVHHIAFIIAGMQEKIMKLERNGIPLIQKGEYPGGRYAYMDANGPLKTLLELLEND